MAEITLTDIENAMITALDSAPISGYAKTIGGYQGEFQKTMGEALILMPAVLVVFADDAHHDANAQYKQYNEISDWDVLVGCKNLRGDLARRQGAAGEVGIYEMLKDVRSALTGNRLGLDIAPLRIVRRWRILVDHRANIYALRFQTMFDYIKA